MPSRVFSYRDGALTCEDVSLDAVAQAHGTPAYVYSRQAIVDRFGAYRNALENGENPLHEKNPNGTETSKLARRNSAAASRMRR